MPHPAFAKTNLAVITGGASGIGLASAKRFAAFGMRLCLVDLDPARLQAAAAEIEGAADILTVAADVGRREEIDRVRDAVLERFGPPDVLMNNAGIQPASTAIHGGDAWSRIIDVNLWGVVHGTQAFVPAMIAHGRPALVINTGSKQGITTPPGNAAYNVSKAGVKVFTETLQHELRNTEGCKVAAHLLIPGFVFTGLTAGDRTEKPAAAWTPEQTADFMLAGIEAGDFYILCPDNDVDRPTDERRMTWAMGDIVQNRPPLSRWHPEYKTAFESFLQEGQAAKP
ncbi:SDR family NAD(P)-dependent oxidoreductase [Lichenicoccus roseus]|uniref:SDR family NAD(P)-dependent oxidoreductase n=1 Tax=Lichenicoccus roseus TaxID=2683649 RepID=A0A5R9J185_9PROT|nr:SDR family NAD(P)-dependent oxidoreductase [Lichenicoccus roseus]TLU71415.1 SDR family NAD(P)-dependent oxidoreductase [Lichenicoccus roseus]